MRYYGVGFPEPTETCSSTSGYYQSSIGKIVLSE